jgi:tripartite-type tricarboxylate transporter receptor subunit TctC
MRRADALLGRAPRGILLAGLLWILCPAAKSQDWPARPVNLVVSVSTNSAPDFIARALAPRLSRVLGQPFVVVNRPGASGNIGNEEVAHAPPDGYTVLLAANTLSAAPFLYRQLGYDPERDLIPVGKMAITVLALTVNPAVPADSLAAFVALAASRPGAINYGTPGVATPHHLAMELFEQRAGIRLTHVPYKAASAAVLDLMAGRVDCMFVPVHSILPLVRAGKLRVLAIASERRTPWFPDIPTVTEAGVDGVDADPWVGMFMPRGTPGAIVERMSALTLQILAQPEVREGLFNQGVVLTPSGPQALAALLHANLARWKDVIQRANIQAD